MFFGRFTEAPLPIGMWRRASLTIAGHVYPRDGAARDVC